MSVTFFSASTERIRRAVENMNLEPFKLERWLSVNPCKYDLASAGITKLKLKDLIDEIDFDMMLSYGLTKGSENLRQKIAATFFHVNTDEVLVTNGTAEANLLILYRLLERGDELVVQMPTYMQSVGFAKSLRIKIKAYYLQENMDYKPDLETMKAIVSKKTKVIFITNPNNPTGSIVSDSELRTICDIAEDVGAYVICDGALRGLEVEGEPSPSPIEVYEKGIATGSLSKIGLSGLRIGWLIADEDLIEDCWAYKDYTTLCHSGIGEYLATIALQKENLSRYFERAKNIIRDHLTILSDWMGEHSQIMSWVPPKAGHTAFLRYSLDIDSAELCRRLLKEKKVLICPGDFFGVPKHLRLRYSCDKETLVEGLNLFDTFMNIIEK